MDGGQTAIYESSHCTLKEGEKVHVHIPQGFEMLFSAFYVLLLLMTAFDLKQVSCVPWKVIGVFKMIVYKWSKADPCLHYS